MRIGVREKAGFHVTLSSFRGVEGSSRYCVFDRDIERTSKATAAAHPMCLSCGLMLRLGNEMYHNI